MFSILESVAFDTGYAGSNGLEPQSWVNGNGTSYIYFGSGEFDGQGSGHDFYGTVSASLLLAGVACRVRPASTGLYVSQPRAGRTNAIVRARPERARGPEASCFAFTSFESSNSLIFSAALHALHRLRQQLRRWPLAHLLRLPPAVSCASSMSGSF